MGEKEKQDFDVLLKLNVDKGDNLKGDIDSLQNSLDAQKIEKKVNEEKAKASERQTKRRKLIRREIRPTFSPMGPPWRLLRRLFRKRNCPRR